MTDSHRDIGAPFIAKVDRDETHDPMCPWFGSGDPWASGSSVHTCACDLIRKVRADERKNPRDEYHTMAELYEYRMLYNAAFAILLSDEYDDAVKSLRHSDGELCFGGGWFVVVMDLPTGQVSNHYENQYWDLFRVSVVERAPFWDGHTPEVAADRLRQYCLGE